MVTFHAEEPAERRHQYTIHVNTKSHTAKLGQPDYKLLIVGMLDRIAFCPQQQSFTRSSVPMADVIDNTHTGEGHLMPG